jgi:hypothetical protein
MATNRVSPKKGKVVDIPDATITIGTPTAGDSQVSVAFTVASTPATGGPVQKYTAISSPGSFTGSATTSPVIVTGLTNGTAYTFTVAAGNATGNGVFSSASASATPFLATSFESIATQTVSGSSVSSITFGSIPSTYKHLQIRGIVACTVAGTDINGLTISCNGDTTNTNYYRHNLYGTGSAAAAFGSNTYAGLVTNGNAPKTSNTNMYGAVICDILDYQNTNKYKTMRALSGADINSADGQVGLASGLWMNTAAITSVTLNITYAGNISVGSTFALYGIKG